MGGFSVNAKQGIFNLHSPVAEGSVQRRFRLRAGAERSPAKRLTSSGGYFPAEQSRVAHAATTPSIFNIHRPGLISGGETACGRRCSGGNHPRNGRKLLQEVICPGGPSKKKESRSYNRNRSIFIDDPQGAPKKFRFFFGRDPHFFRRLVIGHLNFRLSSREADALEFYGPGAAAGAAGEVPRNRRLSRGGTRIGGGGYLRRRRRPHACRVMN